MSISSNIERVRQTLPPHVSLLCVSKYHPVEAIAEAYEAGERMFGESRVQELLQKYEVLPKDIQWHFIGHLQTNKIRPILPFVSLIHGVDSWHLLEAIDKEAEKAQLSHSVRLLLEVKVAQEATKFGFTPSSLLNMLHTQPWQDLKHVQICGIMGMASFTEDTQQIDREFAQLQTLYEQVVPLLQAHYPIQETILSMGMSEDYPMAIQHGSTLVRIGTSIFGEKHT